MDNKSLVLAAWQLLKSVTIPDDSCSLDLQFAVVRAKFSLANLVSCIDRVCESSSDSESELSK